MRSMKATVLSENALAEMGGACLPRRGRRGGPPCRAPPAGCSAARSRRTCAPSWRWPWAVLVPSSDDPRSAELEDFRAIQTANTSWIGDAGSHCSCAPIYSGGNGKSAAREEELLHGTAFN